jgi:hypothetical protein
MLPPIRGCLAILPYCGKLSRPLYSAERAWKTNL